MSQHYYLACDEHRQLCASFDSHRNPIGEHATLAQFTYAHRFCKLRCVDDNSPEFQSVLLDVPEVEGAWIDWDDVVPKADDPEEVREVYDDLVSMVNREVSQELLRFQRSRGKTE